MSLPFSVQTQLGRSNPFWPAKLSSLPSSCQFLISQILLLLCLLERSKGHELFFLVIVQSSTWRYWFHDSCCPTWFQILPSISRTYCDIPELCRRFYFLVSRHAASFSHFQWPLFYVAQFSTIGSLNRFSESGPLLFMMVEPALLVRLSFLAARCRSRSASSLGALLVFLKYGLRVS